MYAEAHASSPFTYTAVAIGMYVDILYVCIPIYMNICVCIYVHVLYIFTIKLVRRACLQ